MSDVKISGLPSSTGVIPASDYIPIVHNGTTEKVTPDQLITGMGLATDVELALKTDVTTTVALTVVVGLKAEAIKTGSNGFMLNNQTVTESYDVPVGYNALAVGPITLAPGVAYNLPAGSRSIIL